MVFQRRVRFFIFRKVHGDREATDDLEQEVFLALQRAIRSGRLSDAEAIAAYAYKTCANLVTRWRDREERTVALTNPNLSCSEENPEKLAINAEAHEQLRKCVDKLRSIDRQILVLHFAEEWSYRDIGDTLSLTEENTRQRACRALARLRERLRVSWELDSSK